MAGPVEEAGKVAVSLIDSMKAQPLVLSVLVSNLVVLGVIYFNAKETREASHQLISLMVTQATRSQELLAKCVVPDDRRGNLLKLPQIPTSLPVTPLRQPAQ
jgi:hypothetical protein